MTVKQNKNTAAEIKLLIQHGIDMSVQQVMKKMNNMRQKIKLKMGRKQKGNREIILNELERKFFELMGCIENHSVSLRSCKFNKITTNLT